MGSLGWGRAGAEERSAPFALVIQVQAASRTAKSRNQTPSSPTLPPRPRPFGRAEERFPEGRRAGPLSLPPRERSAAPPARPSPPPYLPPEHIPKLLSSLPPLREGVTLPPVSGDGAGKGKRKNTGGGNTTGQRGPEQPGLPLPPPTRSPSPPAPYSNSQGGESPHFPFVLGSPAGGRERAENSGESETGPGLSPPPSYGRGRGLSGTPGAARGPGEGGRQGKAAERGRRPAGERFYLRPAASRGG